MVPVGWIVRVIRKHDAAAPITTLYAAAFPTEEKLVEAVKGYLGHPDNVQVESANDMVTSVHAKRLGLVPGGILEMTDSGAA